MTRWLKQWEVPSSKGTVIYTVSVDAQGRYACSCPHWVYRRAECRHIREVSEGLHEQIELPDFVLYNCQYVQQIVNEMGRVVEVRVPLMPLGYKWNHFILTMIYDLMRAGFPLAWIKERYRLQEWDAKRQDIIDYIEQAGRCIHLPLEEGKGYHGQMVVPLEAHEHIT